MPEYDNTNTLTVNANDKGDNEKRPDYRAKINIDGVVYWGSLWKRSSSNGDFLSGPVEKADEQYQPGAKSETPAEGAAEAPAGDSKSYF